ncbi:IS630 transposase-related protein, partial [Phenylobacterium sp.]|uniref:IS630 transposase-related protein n=1 Tax=Phenylobacterium sp. TaxID=1871053 RepID=UPI003523407C
MARPYSSDLRDRVAGFVVSGGTCHEAAVRFGVGVATAVRWSHRLRTTGSAAARPMGGPRRAVLAGERDWLL